MIVTTVTALALVATTAGSARAADDPVTVTHYTDPAQFLPNRAKSHYVQPWRSYMETVPATSMLKAVGINFNVKPQWAESTARVLEVSGFKRARVEFGWNTISYDDPNRMNPANRDALVADLTAMKAHHIRPLIVLNANSGQPCPFKLDTINVTSPAPEGAEELHIDPADVGKIVPGKTGIRSGGTAANYLFTSVSRDGTVQLSAPLGSLWASKASQPAVGSIAAGPLPVETMLYEPFHPETLATGASNPAFEPTMEGWLRYVGVITREAKAILGSEEFDVEVWNELSFGSRFLNVNGYYGTPVDEDRNWNQNAILDRTVAYIRDPAHGVSTIGIGNGFSNESPGWSPEESPDGLTAQDKHPYSGLHSFPGAEKTEATRPVNGLAEEAGIKTAPNLWKPDFTPTYDAFFPEYMLSGLPNQTLVRDLSPVANWYAGSMHGRDVTTPGGDTLEHWITEVNMNPLTGSVRTMSQADVRHMETKEILRYLAAFVNKGYTAIDFYAANDGNFSLIDSSFFTYLKNHASAYPGDDAGGETMAAVARLVKGFSGATRAKHRNLSLDALTDYSGNVQFQGNGTAQYPPLYDRDVFAFLPFQVTGSRFVIPVYVMTRNVSKVYPGAGDGPTRFDMPAEAYKMAIGGVDGEKATASATDPLTGESVPVEVVSRSSDKIVVRMEVTDSPRLLSIDEGNDGQDPGEAEDPTEEPTTEEPTTEEPTTEEPSTEGPPEEEPGEDEPPESDEKPEYGSGTGTETATPGGDHAGQAAEPAAADAPVVRMELHSRQSLLRQRNLRVIARCEEACELHFRAKIRVGGRRFLMRPASGRSGARASAAQASTLLTLRGPATQALLNALKDGTAVTAVVQATASNSLGSTTVSEKSLTVTH